MNIAVLSTQILGNSVAGLLVSPSDDDHSALQAIFSRSNWMLQSASSITEALSAMRRGPVSVIICERELPDGNWELLFQQAQNQPRPPRVIVSSRLADDELWAEVLNLGGYDVLWTPFRDDEVLHAVHLAWESWQRQWGKCVLPRVARAVAAADENVPPAA
jgi:DNA-binding response OmpR family regulator